VDVNAASSPPVHPRRTQHPRRPSEPVLRHPEVAARTRPQHSSTLPGPARHAPEHIEQAPAVLISLRNKCRIRISPTARQRPIQAAPSCMRTQNTQLRMP